MDDYIPVRAVDLTDEQKLEFLELVRQGYIRPEAATKVGSTGSQFKKLCNPESYSYDSRFAGIYNQIIETREHEENRLERLRMATWRRAIDEGSDRIMEKLNIIHDPEWAIFRTQKIEVNANLESFIHEKFGHLNAEQLRKVLEIVEENGEEAVLEAFHGETREIEAPQ